MFLYLFVFKVVHVPEDGPLPPGPGRHQEVERHPAGAPYCSYEGFSLQLEHHAALTKVKSTARSCNDINYQEIHKIGAVFSHGFDYVLEEMGADKEMKLRVLVKWLKTLSEKHETLKDSLAGDYLFSASKLYLETAQEVMELEDNTSGCLALTRIFPSKKSEVCETQINSLL